MVPYKILDLFAGAGGLSLGFELLKDKDGKQIFELYRAVEMDKYACETLRLAYGDEKVIEGDLTKKKIHEKVIDACQGKVSVIMGGIPCQSFSLIGPRSGYGKKKKKFNDDERDNLYMEFRKIVKELIPKIIVIENVKGILSKKDKKDKKIIDNIINDFEKLGYNFENTVGNKYQLLNAADFGVPQKRERVILIGVLNRWKNNIKIPVISPTHSAKKEKGSKLLPWITVFDAIGDLPVVMARKTKTDIPKKGYDKIENYNKQIDFGKDRINLDADRFKNHSKRLKTNGKQFLSFIRPNGYEYIDNHVARSQQTSDIELFGEMKAGETAEEFRKRQPVKSKKLIKYDMKTFKDKYRKQKWDEPATTLFAHLEKDGNRFIHPEQLRTITPREAARLQSFPDNRVFSGPISKKFRQIGNAVPPLLGNNIAKTVYSVLGDE